MKKQEVKIEVGHVWERQSGGCAGWTGWYGLFICKRCLNTLKSYQKSADSPYEHEEMKDIFGKRVPKKNWNKCQADKSFNN